MDQKVSLENLGIDKNFVRPSSSVSVKTEGGVLRLEKKWFSISSLPTIFMGIFWNIISTTTVIVMLIHPDPKGTSLLTWIIVSVFPLVGVFLFYKTLCEILNKTTILLRPDKILFQTSPLGSNGSFPVSQIANFSVDRSDGGTVNNRKIFVQHVYLNLKTGDRVKVCPAKDLNEAFFIEKTLEEYLQMQDRPELNSLIV